MNAIFRVQEAVLPIRNSLILLITCLGFLVGCADRESGVAHQNHTISSSSEEKGVGTELNILVETRAIPATSQLSGLAEALDRVAVERSVPLQDLRSAQARRSAAQFERYPSISPIASAPLTGGDPSFGINIEQTIWDGGRIRGRLTDVDLDIAKARVDTWQDRNLVIFEGLSAFTDIQRYTARIESFSKLERQLRSLSDILRDRVLGGVADRGEQLRMSLSLQEVQRDIVSDQSKLRTAESTLARFLPQSSWPKIGVGLLSQSGVCDRKWPINEAPEVAQARVRVMRAENQRNMVLARRLPRVVLGAGSTFTSDGLSKPTAALQLDASDMLGLGRKQSIEAAEAEYSGALRSYDLEKNDMSAELQQLEQDYVDYLSDIDQLKALQRTNDDNLKLYREQVEAGTIPIAEGITLFRESTNTVVDLVDARARALENCLETARLRGALAPFGISHE